ncbi:MAG: hypothetical protein LBD77_06500 [Bifidobacteriaceae bacterium]|nr:hypothetical protein [Bifidobacteriaceae bacterium]
MRRWRRVWGSFQRKHPGVAQFAVFFLISNAVTVLQLAMMPAVKAWFGQTALVDTPFRHWPVGSQVDGSPFYIFDYAAGPLPDGGGGLAYFLAVQLTLLVAQVVNFFAQRGVTFKANNSIAKAAFWYLVAYVAITIGAAALQGFYKAPIYRLLITTWGWGAAGEVTADVITMLINAALSFWVFFPIFRVIFRSNPSAPAPSPAPGAATPDAVQEAPQPGGAA